MSTLSPVREQLADVTEGNIFRYDDKLYRVMRQVCDDADCLLHTEVLQVGVLMYGHFIYAPVTILQHFNPYCWVDTLTIL